MGANDRHELTTTFPPHPDDPRPPLPWLDTIRADIRAAGGASTVSPVQAMADRMRTSVAWSVADGKVLFRPHDGAGGWRVLSGEALATWASATLRPLDRLPDAAWRDVAALVEPWVRDQHERARAARPADVRTAEEAQERQRAADRAAERERLRAALAALDGTP